MAETIEMNSHELEHKFGSKQKANAGLTLGIIGTALGAMNTGLGSIKGFGFGGNSSPSCDALGVERKQCSDLLDLTRQYYEGKAETTAELNNLFFDSYKRDIENTWTLYKNQRDEDDAIKADMNSKFFQTYQMEQADKNALANKINEVEKKVDVMAAIRPYQDALINCKIDNNALISAYELQKRTCRMIQGELVLPSSNSVTGFPSFNGFSCNCTSSSTSGSTVG